MARTTLIGKILNKLAAERKSLREGAIKKLWLENGLDNSTRRQGYKIKEIKTVNSNGDEVISFQLWKLVDQNTLTISTEITGKIDGIKQKEVNNASGATQNDSTKSPI